MLEFDLCTVSEACTVYIHVFVLNQTRNETQQIGYGEHGTTPGIKTVSIDMSLHNLESFQSCASLTSSFVLTCL